MRACHAASRVIIAVAQRDVEVERRRSITGRGEGGGIVAAQANGVVAHRIGFERALRLVHACSHAQLKCRTEVGDGACCNSCVEVSAACRYGASLDQVVIGIQVVYQ
ncbi:hypothetical protein D3C78_1472050 [compost metagenome]